mmetsp:Transcript_56580/g.134446  ORF Transcript_56580/g.134446 Transcript_56580/m.134446 type:complete len:200 (-) Transcript_56580:62-661(-)
MARWAAWVAQLLALVLVVQSSFALQGEELHDTVGKMKDAEHDKFTKSHKKFRYFDDDKDEHITRTEFQEGLSKLGYRTTDKKLDHIMEELDREPRDGKVNFVEFMRPTALKYKEEQELQRDADTDRAMEHFDANFDGLVSPGEFYEGLQHLPALKKVPEKAILDFFTNYADANQDGFLSYEEIDAVDPEVMYSAEENEA